MTAATAALKPWFPGDFCPAGTLDGNKNLNKATTISSADWYYCPQCRKRANSIMDLNTVMDMVIVILRASKYRFCIIIHIADTLWVISPNSCWTPFGISLCSTWHASERRSTAKWRSWTSSGWVKEFIINNISSVITVIICLPNLFTRGLQIKQLMYHQVTALVFPYINTSTLFRVTLHFCTLLVSPPGAAGTSDEPQEAAVNLQVIWTVHRIFIRYSLD